MKKVLRALAIGLLLFAASNCSPIYGQTVIRGSYESPGAAVDVSYFYNDLNPYGQWIDYPPYGWCWTPYDVSSAWRPYSDGYWVYSDFGWSWISYEPFGWATYHYGRWVFDPYYGWVWVPGTIWAPAWVAWRHGDDWVGWAPLPPQATWQVSVGLRFGDSHRIPDHDWCFVHRRDFLDTRLRAHVVSVARNGSLLSRTRDVTRYEVRRGLPVNHGVDVRSAEKWTGKQVRRFEVADAPSPRRNEKDALRGGRVEYFRPEIRSPEKGKSLRPRVEDRGHTMSDAESRREWQSRREKLEGDLARERSRLETTQKQELRSRPRGVNREQMAKRQSEEKQAFERHAARQRQVLEERQQKGIQKPARGKQSEQPRGSNRGDERSGGKGRGRDR